VRNPARRCPGHLHRDNRSNRQRIPPPVSVRVVSVHGNQVRLAIEAPESVRVDRQEDHARGISPPPHRLGRPRPPTQQTLRDC
jgi:hypothetical protein